MTAAGSSVSHVFLAVSLLGTCSCYSAEPADVWWNADELVFVAEYHSTSDANAVSAHVLSLEESAVFVHGSTDGRIELGPTGPLMLAASNETRFEVVRVRFDRITSKTECTSYSRQYFGVVVDSAGEAEPCQNDEPRFAFSNSSYCHMATTATFNTLTATLAEKRRSPFWRNIRVILNGCLD